ncbi:hypothetical protein DXG03_006360 [Asterophora parasitica]|uniref:Uncharacterized protein n=1 Tax=Asterophora parasitica TaxID=117018 RepID=A0A9P7G2R6_9AGAR|nr:hypothetical protein DXG03_006360 [Asterophora parasitica]
MALGPLDFDTQSIVFSLADTPTLLTLSRTSKSLGAQARAVLLRDVSLSQDPAQVINFQHFVVENKLGHHIRRLFIRRGAFHSNPPFLGPRGYTDNDSAEPEVVAGAVAEVLAETPHLRVLCVDKFAQEMLAMEPRLGKALTSCNHLTDLTLRDVGADALNSLSELRGLRQLALVAYRALDDLIWPDYFHIPQGSSISTVILNSSSTLESLSLTGFRLHSLFSDSTISFPKVHSISYLECEATLEHQERAFPAVRNVHFDPMPFSEATLSSFAPFWFHLESIQASSSFIRIFQKCHGTLRRVGLTEDHLLPGPQSSDARLMLSQLGSTNHLVSLSLTIQDPTAVVLESILKEALHLAFLDLVLIPRELAETNIVREMLVRRATKL